MDFETDRDPVSMHARARRAVALIGVSIIAATAVAISYVDPILPTMGTNGLAPRAGLTYQVAAIDFVTPSTGWLVAVFASGDFAVLHTADGGATWTRQLSGPTHSHAPYLKFFDSAVGVFALVGTSPLLNRTYDGGRTWSSRPALNPASSVLSWSFVDSDNGWMLVSEATRIPSPARLRPRRTGS
jgi:photosystem II stability/assembly factor-like uncharacterized protein